VCLRPAIVDDVLAPTAFAIRCLLLFKPENTVVMTQTGEEIRKSITVDVHYKNEPGCAKLEFRVKAPFFISPIERRFKPTLGSDDICTAIPIDVARPDAMPIALRALPVISMASSFWTVGAIAGLFLFVGMILSSLLAYFVVSVMTVPIVVLLMIAPLRQVEIGTALAILRRHW